jgi:transmembrane sensor
MTQPSREQLNELADKWLKGMLTSQEKELLDKWYDFDSSEPIHWTGAEESEEQLAQRLLYNIQKEKKTVPFKRRWQIPAAAIILISVGISSYFYFSKPTGTVQQTNVQVGDIDPAGNKAYLTLSNGKRIVLTDASNGNIASQSNVQITKTADGQLVYTVAESNSNVNAPLEYNTIETPNGGKYEITLPDGTHVSVNAASTLKFPVSFASLKERRVQLQGEAYFEVAHNKMVPFRVSSAGQTVEVLGTHFNINAYSNEMVVKTTLLEGSVKILADHGKNFKILKPGEEATLQNDALQVSKADIEQALSWKNGDFVFTGEDLKVVMRQVARWYDVEVEYKGEVHSSGVVSTISRTKKLSQLLKALEANQKVHFKMEGRRVLVMP